MERKMSVEEYFYMPMAKRKEKRPLVRNYTDALQTLPTDPETSEASDTFPEWNSALFLRTLLEKVDREATRKRSSTMHGPPAKRQRSPVKTNSPRKLQLDYSWETGKVAPGTRPVLGLRLLNSASLGESSWEVKSAVKNRNSSGKKNNEDEVFISILAGSGRSLLENSVTKRQSVKDNHGDVPLLWKKGRLLGAGAFGKVYECFSAPRSPDFKARLAVKIVKIEPQYAQEVKVFKNEIDIVMNLRHDKIVSCYGFQERDDHLHLFMEYMAGGSLSDHIKNHKVLFESESRRYTMQILEAVSFLHAKNIIHRDIKGSNVLLDGKGNVKLADFGLSKIIQKIGSKTDLVSHCGTPHWMAPELIRGKGYGRKADIWSVGCTVVEMLTGRPPLGHLEPVAAIFEIGTNPTVPALPEDVSQDAKDFIQAALTPDPLERPWSEELLKHNFVVVSTDW